MRWRTQYNKKKYKKYKDTGDRARNIELSWWMPKIKINFRRIIEKRSNTSNL